MPYIGLESYNFCYFESMIDWIFIAPKLMNKDEELFVFCSDDQSIMNKQSYKTIHEYSQLIAFLKPTAFYHKRLQFILFMIWFLSGLLQSLFDITIAQRQTTVAFFSQNTTQIIAIVISSYMSLSYSRHYINAIASVLVFIGAIIVMVAIEIEDFSIGKIIGVSFISTFHYCLTINILFIAMEFFQKEQYPQLICLALLSFTCGRAVSVAIVHYVESQQALAAYVILPSSALFILILPLYSESPRFLIDQNIPKAEKLIKSITKMNGVPADSITVLMEKQFFWNKINLKKYGFQTLYQHESLSIPFYVSCICFLLLGVVCRCPDYILHQQKQSQSSFQVQDSIQILWISCFQLCALLPAYVSMGGMQRRRLIVGLSFIIMGISLNLTFISVDIFDDAIVYSMALFGLNAFFCVGLFAFLLLQVSQILPYTIRTFGCGLLIGLYKLGKLLFSFHIEQINNSDILLELMICASVVLWMHSFLIVETLHENIHYEVKEIEEMDANDE